MPAEGPRSRPSDPTSGSHGNGPGNAAPDEAGAFCLEELSPGQVPDERLTDALLSEATGGRLGMVLPRVAPAVRTASRKLAAGARRSVSDEVVPHVTRPAYRLEFSSVFFLSMLNLVTEGALVGVLVKNGWDAVMAQHGAAGSVMLNFVVAALAAAPAFANITSFVWTKLSHGRPKVRFITGLQLALAVCVALVALVPVNTFGLFALAALVISGRMIIAGIITLRANVWNANYPRRRRASITGRFATVQALLLGAGGVAVGLALENNPEAFRWVFPAAAAIGLIGIRQYARIRQRRARQDLAAERATHRSGSPSFNPMAMVRVLSDDTRFRRYMSAQFLLGVSNMSAWAPFIIMVEERFGYGYLLGILLSQAVPMLIMPLSVAAWSALLDRVHVVEFRALHSWVFVGMLLSAAAAAATGIPAFLFLSAVLKGVAFGGGALAWQLGHLDFAPRGREAQYMSVHVTLTGVRGLMAPFIGVLLYAWLDRVWLPADAGSVIATGGFALFALCTVGGSCAAIIFMRMRRDIERGDRS